MLTQLVGRALARRNWGRLRFTVDATVLYLAAVAALLASPRRDLTAGRWLILVFPILVLVIIHARRGPDERLRASRLDTAAHVLGVVSLAAMLTIALGTVVHEAHPVILAVRLWLFGFAYLAAARCVLVSVRRGLAQSDWFGAPTLIVGAGRVGERLVKRLAGDRGYGLQPIGFLDADRAFSRGQQGSLPVLGSPNELAQVASQTGARNVILAFPAEPDHVLVNRVRECQKLGLRVSLVPRLYETINERATVDHVGGLPLVALRTIDPHGWEFAVKHALDRAFAALALIALAPLMLAIALSVRLASPGPILFRQRRVGRDGHEFDLLKFRTMREPREGQAFAPRDGCAPGGIEGEDRRTKVGRLLRDFSLDELPQFINVLRGDMSVVGPRPERPEFVERFSLEVERYDDRHRVKSGITGWAQVHGLRGQTSIADRVEWDNYYIRNWSLRLDLEILARTLGEVLSRQSDR